MNKISEVLTYENIYLPKIYIELSSSIGERIALILPVELI